jgi:membrane protease YdiL (CAAX protease family)
MAGVGARESRLRLIGLSLGVTIGAVLFGIALLILMAVALNNLGVTLDGPTQLVLSLVALQGIAFPVSGYLYLRWRGRSLDFIPVSLPNLREVAFVLVGWITALGLVFAASLIVAALGGEAAQNQAGQTALENPEFIPYLIPLVFLLNGPGEELLFRGVIQGTLRERFSGPAAIVLASLMFAPLHIIALTGSLEAALTTIAILFVPSLVFGAVYELTDNFVVPSVVHGLYNATLFGLVYLAATTDAGQTTQILVIT